MSPTATEAERYHRLVRRDEIVEVLEVKPLTVADIADDREQRVLAGPTPPPQPVRA
jgi:hypothetical protein